ncbi:unnamed protein product [Auanema sp. JU1783]|nr:unnamed protein product [Auanema sp. JU1783]
MYAPRLSRFVCSKCCNYYIPEDGEHIPDPANDIYDQPICRRCLEEDMEDLFAKTCERCQTRFNREENEYSDLCATCSSLEEGEEYDSD